MTHRHVLFTTDRLTVTLLSLADADLLLPVLSHPATMALYGSGVPLDREDIARMIASYPQGSPDLLAQPGAIWLTGTETVIGFGGVGYYRAPGNLADVLVAIDHRYQGQGYGTELVRGAIATAFTIPEIDVIHATVHPDNAASIRMLERARMRYVESRPDRNRLVYRIERGNCP